MCFKVILVKIRGRDGTKEIVTYMFLDGGSDASFCLESLVRELDLKDKKPTSLMIMTVSSKERMTGNKVQLVAKSLEGDTEFKLDHVLTTDSLPVSARHIASNEDIRKWPHFDDISLPETGDRKVTSLIGSNHPDIINKQLDKRKGGIVIPLQ